MRNFLLICVLCTFFTSPPVYAATVTSVDLSHTQNGYALTLFMSGKTEHNAFTLSGPDRLVVDITNASWGASGRTSKIGPVSAIRHGEQEGGKIRLVLDLERPVTVSRSQYTDKKLIVYFEEKSPAPASLRYGYNTESPFNVPTFNPDGWKQGFASAGATPTQNTSFSAPIPQKKPYASTAYRPVIVIDPGHGGIDPGATGRGGTKEKIITLQYAKALKDTLQATGKYRVYLTREDDRYIKLYDRVKKARQFKGDLLISLHADSSPNKSTRGLSVYTLSEKRAKYEAKKLTQKADEENVIRGVDMSRQSSDVQHMLVELTQRRTVNTSAAFADIVVKEVGENARLLKNSHRHAGFAVLTGADVPSVLIELGYLSNAQEEKELKTYKHRTRIIRGLYNAIDTYFTRYPPTG